MTLEELKDAIDTMLINSTSKGMENLAKYKKAKVVFWDTDGNRFDISSVHFSEHFNEINLEED